MGLDRRPTTVLRDAGIPDKPGLLEMEPFPREDPRLRPRLFEVAVEPDGVKGWEFEGKSPCVLGGEDAEEVLWLLVEELEFEMGAEELAAFLACCCCTEG